MSGYTYGYEAIDSKLDELTPKRTTVELSTKLSETSKALDDVSKSVDSLNSRVDVMDTHITSLQDKIVELTSSTMSLSGEYVDGTSFDYNVYAG